MPSSSQVKGTELPPQHPSSCCSLIFGPMAFMVLLDFIQTHVVSDINTGVEDFSAEINWIKHFVCFDDSGRQRGKSSTCMWSLNRTLISVPNTVFFFSCFCIYLLFFFLLFSKRKTHLRSSGELSPALRTGEDLFCCLWQSIQKFLFIFLFFLLSC